MKPKTTFQSFVSFITVVFLLIGSYLALQTTLRYQLLDQAKIQMDQACAYSMNDIEKTQCERNQKLFQSQSQINEYLVAGFFLFVGAGLTYSRRFIFTSKQS